MKIISSLTFLILVIFLSCKQQKPATQTAPTPTPQKTKAVDPGKGPIDVSSVPIDNATIEPEGGVQKKQEPDSIMTFIASFYSIGSGIDRGEPEKLVAFTEAFGKKIDAVIEYKVTHWGREGETDYCFPLKGLSDNNVSEFVKGAKEALKSAQHVHFLGNQVCRERR